MTMRNRLSKLALTLIVALGAGGAGCVPALATATPAYPSEAGAMTVSAGENFYGDILHQLGGSRLRIYAFLSNPSADPHQYESNTGNAQAVADSRLVVVNGLGYDAFMDRLLQASPRAGRVVIRVAQVAGAPDGANPHLWYDPGVMPRVARAVAAALARLDPANSTRYGANLVALLSALAPIADRMAVLRTRFLGTPVAFTEPVYGYAAAALGLTVRSPVAFMRAVEEGNDPPTRAVAEEEDLLTHHQVKVLVYNSQVVTPITSAIRDLARRSRVPVVGISETEPVGRTYQQWQLDALAALEAALGR